MVSVEGVLGFTLIIFAILIYIFAVPALNTAIDTSDGTALENKSTTIKNIYGQMDIFIASLPFVMFVVGGIFMAKGR